MGGKFLYSMESTSPDECRYEGNNNTRDHAGTKEDDKTYDTYREYRFVWVSNQEKISIRMIESLLGERTLVKSLLKKCRDPVEKFFYDRRHLGTGITNNIIYRFLLGKINIRQDAHVGAHTGRVDMLKYNKYIEYNVIEDTLLVKPRKKTSELS